MLPFSWLIGLSMVGAGLIIKMQKGGRYPRVPDAVQSRNRHRTQHFPQAPRNGTLRPSVVESGKAVFPKYMHRGVDGWRGRDSGPARKAVI